MNSYMEYKEFEVPEEVQNRLEKLAEMGSADPQTRPTLANAGFFEWLNKLSREEGWRVVWNAFQFPYVVLEREVAVEAETPIDTAIES